MGGHAVAQIGGILASAMMVPKQAKGPSESQRQEQSQLSVASLKASMRSRDGEKKTAFQISVFVPRFRTVSASILGSFDFRQSLPRACPGSM